MWGKSKEQKEKDNQGKTINAQDLLKHPEMINDLTGRYQVIQDLGFAGNPMFHNMNRAINLMAENGWRCVNISTLREQILQETGMMYALMEKAHQ